MTERSHVAPTWDAFVDDVLPWVGSPSLAGQLAAIAPTLNARELAVWVKRFNDSDAAHRDGIGAADHGWEQDEADGIWYDHMKAIALQCLMEIDLHVDNEPRARPS